MCRSAIKDVESDETDATPPNEPTLNNVEVKARLRQIRQPRHSTKPKTSINPTNTHWHTSCLTESSTKNSFSKGDSHVVLSTFFTFSHADHHQRKVTTNGKSNGNTTHKTGESGIIFTNGSSTSGIIFTNGDSFDRGTFAASGSYLAKPLTRLPA